MAFILHPDDRCELLVILCQISSTSKKAFRRKDFLAQRLPILNMPHLRPQRTQSSRSCYPSQNRGIIMYPACTCLSVSNVQPEKQRESVAIFLAVALLHDLEITWMYLVAHAEVALILFLLWAHWPSWMGTTSAAPAAPAPPTDVRTARSTAAGTGPTSGGNGGSVSRCPLGASQKGPHLTCSGHLCTKFDAVELWGMMFVNQCSSPLCLRFPVPSKQQTFAFGLRFTFKVV